MIVKLLTEHHLEFLSLKGGCRGSSESTLDKMSNCWKSHVAALLVLIAYAQIFHINDHSDISRVARGLNFGLSPHLHPYFVYTSSEGSGESANLRRLA